MTGTYLSSTCLPFQLWRMEQCRIAPTSPLVCFVPSSHCFHEFLYWLFRPESPACQWNSVSCLISRKVMCSRHDFSHFSHLGPHCKAHGWVRGLWFTTYSLEFCVFTSIITIELYFPSILIFFMFLIGLVGKNRIKMSYSVIFNWKTIVLELWPWYRVKQMEADYSN